MRKALRACGCGTSGRRWLFEEHQSSRRQVARTGRAGPAANHLCNRQLGQLCCPLPAGGSAWPRPPENGQVGLGLAQAIAFGVVIGRKDRGARCCSATKPSDPGGGEARSRVAGLTSGGAQLRATWARDSRTGRRGKVRAAAAACGDAILSREATGHDHRCEAD